MAETHSAVVFFLGDHAYKVKKPVDLGFLDFSTRELRELACHREVDLNRRLAPDVYVGVADVIGPDGLPLEHLVVMQRMPDERRLARLAVEGGSLDAEIAQIARTIAAFHARARRSTIADELASVDATRALWGENTGALIAGGGTTFDESTVATVHALAMRYLDGRRPLFAARTAEGRAVDGHGDLLADDIFCLPDGPRVLDCLDFDERLRMGDGLADVAFLAMDLDHLGRPDLSERLLTSYGEHSGDVWPPSLAHHHVAYRAQVRAKVTALRAAEGDEEAASAARDLLDLALRHLEAGRVRLVLVGGPPASGKTTLARSLARELDAVVLHSDVIRKELAGVPATTSLAVGFEQADYRPHATERTYRTCMERAEIALGMGATVILDASWARADLRDQARHLARRTCADLIELCCWAPVDVCEGRIEQRQATGGDASDATAAIAASLRERFDPWPEADLVDTSRGGDRVAEHALQAVHLRRIGPVPVG